MSTLNRYACLQAECPFKLFPAFSILLLCGTSWHVFCQEVAERQPMRFGVFAGINRPLIEISKFGMTVGADVYFYPASHLGLSFKPDLSVYIFQVPGHFKPVGSLEWELPLHGVLRMGKGPVRPVFEAGPNYKTDLLGSNKPMIGWDVSVGTEVSDAIFFKVKKDVHEFSILPELRYSYSREFGAVYFTLHFLGSG